MFEIERKYLISFPEKEALATCLSESEIIQTYLISDSDFSSERVRKRTYSDGRVICTHTCKKHVTDVKRVELEEEIDIQTYELLLNRKDKSRSEIRKRRYCFESGGKVFELDVYPFWEDRAILEIELKNEDEEFLIPESFHVIKEVTSDKRYTNSALAKQVPFDELWR